MSPLEAAARQPPPPTLATPRASQRSRSVSKVIMREEMKRAAAVAASATAAASGKKTDQHRARSSMRIPPSRSSLPDNEQRARPLSARRLRTSSLSSFQQSLDEMDDPNAVAKAILDLREQRELHKTRAKQQKSKLRSSNINGSQMSGHTQPLSESTAAGPTANSNNIAASTATSSGKVQQQQQQRPPSQPKAGRNTNAVSKTATTTTPKSPKSPSPQQQRRKNHPHAIIIRGGPLLQRAPSNATLSQHSSESTSVSTTPAPPPPTAPPAPSTKPGPPPPPSTKEEEHAQQALTQAERNLNSLLQEMEELKFFQELDDDNENHDAAAAAPVPLQKRLGASRYEKQAAPPPPLPLSSPPPARAAAAAASSSEHHRDDGVPALVRAISPTRDHQRLPPPPPTQTFEMELPSPRQISKMERNILELETQTLCRRLQVLAQEKDTLAHEMLVLEHRVTDYERQLQTSVQLETKLASVQTQLARAAQSMGMVRSQLEAEYETQLATTTQVWREQLDTEHREKLRQEIDRRKADHERRRAALKEEWQQERHAWSKKESNLEDQLNETTDVLAGLEQVMAERDAEMEQLKLQLAEAGQALSEQEHDYHHHDKLQQREIDLLQEKLTRVLSNKDDLTVQLVAQNVQFQELSKKAQAWQKLPGQVTELENMNKTLLQGQQNTQHELDQCRHELQRAQQRARQAADEHATLSRDLRAAQQATQTWQAQQQDQAQLVTDMTARLDSVHGEYRVKFSELKEAYDQKEKRRLNELVESHADENKEYERRILALQEQLSHQANRHFEEIRKKDVEREQKLEALRASLRREVEIENGDRVHHLEEQLAIVRQEHDEAETERRRLRKEKEQQEADKAGFAATNLKELREWEYQDGVRQNEILRLREKAERLVREITEKDARIHDLTARQSEHDAATISRLGQLEAAHAATLMQRDEQVATLKKEHRSVEVKLRSELSRKEADWDDTRATHESKLAELRQELEQSSGELKRLRHAMHQHESLQERWSDLQVSYERVHKELSAEQARHETATAELKVEQAKLEGKLHVSESTLQQKRDYIEELETKMQQTVEESAASAQGVQKQLERLKEELDECKIQLATERSNAKRANDKVMVAMGEQKQLRRKLARLEEVEEQVVTLKKSLAEAEHAKIAHVSELTRLQAMHEEAVRQLSIYEEKVADGSSKSLVDKLEEASYASKQYAANVTELNEKVNALKEKLAAVKAEKQGLRDKVDELEGDMEYKEHQLARIPKLQLQIKDATTEAEELREKLRAVEADLMRKEADLETDRQHAAEGQAEWQSKLDEAESAKAALRAQLQAVEVELEMKADTIETHIPALRSEAKTAQAAKCKLEARLQAVENDLTETRQALDARAADTSAEAAAAIADLRRSKEDLEARLTELQNEAAEREKQVKESAEKYSNQVFELQMKVDEMTRAKNALQLKLAHATAELERGNDSWNASTTQFTSELEALSAKLSESMSERQRIQARLDDVETMLAEKEKELVGTREKRSLKLQLQDVEDELQRKEKQIKDLADRYSKEIEEIEDKLADAERSKGALEREVASLKKDGIEIEAASRERRTFKARIRELEDDVDRKEKQLKDVAVRHSAELEELQDRVTDEVRSREHLARKLVEMEDNDKASTLLTEKRVLDLESDLESANKEKRALTSQLRDLEESEDGKENRMKELVQRFSADIEQLEDCLADEKRTKMALEDEVQELRARATNIADSNAEVQALRDRIDSLQCKLEEHRESSEQNRKTGADFEKAEDEKRDLSERLAKANSERAEVISALEEVINEVQSREEEIESLANVLRKRDEELEHAKLIATKALASAQEIKARYKDRSSSKHVELEDEISDLKSNLKFLEAKNESLQRQNSNLEREMHEKESHCRSLRSQLRQPPDLDEKKDCAGDLGTRSTETFEADFANFDETPDVSPTPSSSQDIMHDAMSTHSADLGNATGWLHDFDSVASNDSSDCNSFPGTRTEPSLNESRRNIERDALRKYVRKRYLKSKGSSSSSSVGGGNTSFAI